MSPPSYAELPRWQRSLLPRALIDAPDAGRSLRDWLVDLVLWLIAIAIGGLVLAEDWAVHTPALRVTDIVIGALALVLLAWRRPHPVLVGVLVIGASAVSALAAGPAVVAGFNAAIRAPRRGLAVVVGVSLLSAAVYPGIYPSGEGWLFTFLIGVLITGVLTGWGLFVRARRELVRSLRERAEHAEADAREAERRRIAREMHDVLAHRISLLSVHAGALEFHPDAPAEEVAEAAGVIRESARAALEELRTVIGVLRDGAEGAGPEPPQPTLADVPALVAESSAAGMVARCRIELPAAEPVPDALGRTVYRVVQEGLTNARKHAPGAAVDVAVTGTAQTGLVVEVTSRAPVGVVAEALPGAGTGLVGLAERVSLAGGTLQHGFDAAGAFVLRTRLPWSA